MILLVGALAALAPAISAGAQDLEPRAYRSLPTGLNFLVVSLGRSEGNVIFDPSLPIKDLEAEIDTAIAAYFRSLSLWGRSASVTAIVPFVNVRATGLLEGELVGGRRSGTGDLRLRLAVNLLGGPALSPEEFRDYRQRRNVGVSLAISAPTGQYDSSRLINFGSNRWGFKPEIGYSSIRGRWILEAAAGVWLYTTNDDFVGVSREQDPIGSFQTHISYSFKPGLWLALGGTYFTGGLTRVDGIERSDLQKNARIGLTLSIPVGQRQSVKVATHTGAFTRVGADFDVATLSYQLGW